MSNQVVTLIETTIKLCQDTANGVLDPKDFDLLIESLNQSAQKLQLVIDVLQGKVELPKPTIEMSGPPEFKHAPEMEALLSGKAIGAIPADQVWKTKELNQYSFIQVLKVTDSIITYVRIKDSKQEILWHKIELTKPEYQGFELEQDCYYLIHVTELAKKKRGQPRPDNQWNFIQELPKTKAFALANKWASIFAKRKADGLAY